MNKIYKEKSKAEIDLQSLKQKLENFLPEFMGDEPIQHHIHQIKHDPNSGNVIMESGCYDRVKLILNMLKDVLDLDVTQKSFKEFYNKSFPPQVFKLIKNQSRCVVVCDSKLHAMMLHYYLNTVFQNKNVYRWVTNDIRAQDMEVGFVEWKVPNDQEYVAVTHTDFLYKGFDLATQFDFSMVWLETTAYSDIGISRMLRNFQHKDGSPKISCYHSKDVSMFQFPTIEKQIKKKFPYFIEIVIQTEE